MAYRDRRSTWEEALTNALGASSEELCSAVTQLEAAHAEAHAALGADHELTVMMQAALDRLGPRARALAKTAAQPDPMKTPYGVLRAVQICLHADVHELARLRLLGQFAIGVSPSPDTDRAMVERALRTIEGPCRDARRALEDSDEAHLAERSADAQLAAAWREAEREVSECEHAIDRARRWLAQGDDG